MEETKLEVGSISAAPSPSRVQSCSSPRKAHGLIS